MKQRAEIKEFARNVVIGQFLLSIWTDAKEEDNKSDIVVLERIKGIIKGKQGFND